MPHLTAVFVVDHAPTLAAGMDEVNANPLLQSSQVAWDRFVAAANPPALLVAIRGFLSSRLRASVEADDVLQEALLVAWRDRASFQWLGLASFRRWLLQIARRRVCDLADRVAAQKRGSGQMVDGAGASASDSGDAAVHYAGPQRVTTPSRVATDRELATGLERALDEVPDEWREVVRLRLFEELDFTEISRQLSLGPEAVRYRFRHGAEAYRRGLRKLRIVTSSAGRGR